MNDSLRCHCRGYERKNLCDIWKCELDNFVTGPKLRADILRCFIIALLNNCSLSEHPEYRYHVKKIEASISKDNVSNYNENITGLSGLSNGVKSERFNL